MLSLESHETVTLIYLSMRPSSEATWKRWKKPDTKLNF